jgi:hypothetical protein
VLLVCVRSDARRADIHANWEFIAVQAGLSFPRASSRRNLCTFWKTHQGDYVATLVPARAEIFW